MNSLKLVFSNVVGFFKHKRPINMKNLAVFDFDHTVVDDNSDTAVVKLVSKSKITPELKDLHKADGWTAYMQGVFKVLHQNKVTETGITNLIKDLPEVSGIRNLITQLHDNMNYDVIIISDSNTYFINAWLQANNLDSKILRVFSNPAEFNDHGLLIIKMYHVQESCKLSTRNMCKGMILEDFVKAQAEKGTKYEKVVYIGDGQNDFCPILRLNKTDIACVRNKYKCADLIRKSLGKNKEGKHKDESDGTKYTVKSQVCIWDHGQEILDFLKNSLKP